jgi:hypothetical protein
MDDHQEGKKPKRLQQTKRCVDGNHLHPIQVGVVSDMVYAIGFWRRER